MEMDNYRRNNRVLTGLFLVIGGGLYLAYLKGLPIPYWVFSWQMMVIAFGLLSGFRHGFRNPGWLIMVVVGGIFLLDGEIPGLNFHQYIIPMVLIGVGILFIFRPGNCRRFHFKRIGKDWSNKFEDKWDRKRGWKAACSNEGTENGEFIQSTSIFSGVNKKVLSKGFKGGNITCVFGGAEIDLTQAEISGATIIRVELVFGGIKLLVPPHWVVNNEIDGMFHGVEDKRQMQPGVIMDTTKVLVLKGSCVFGGIEVKSY